MDGPTFVITWSRSPACDQEGFLSPLAWVCLEHFTLLSTLLEKRTLHRVRECPIESQVGAFHLLSLSPPCECARLSRAKHTKMVVYTVGCFMC